MSYKYNSVTDKFEHIDDEEPIEANCTIKVPNSCDCRTAYLHELTDDCIERIAEAVVRKLKETDHED